MRRDRHERRRENERESEKKHNAMTLIHNKHLLLIIETGLYFNKLTPISNK